MNQIGAPALSIKHLSLGQPPNLRPKLQVGIKVWIHVEGEGIPFTWMKGALEFWRMSKLWELKNRGVGDVPFLYKWNQVRIDDSTNYSNL